MRRNVDVFCVCIFRSFKPATFADCLGDELPFGWEVAYDPHIGTYYVNHLTSELITITVSLHTFFAS